MRRESHVRICERLGVKSPGPTRHSGKGRGTFTSSSGIWAKDSIQKPYGKVEVLASLVCKSEFGW